MVDYNKLVGGLILQAIWAEGGLVGAEICERLGLEPAAAGLRLRELLDAGLIEHVEERMPGDWSVTRWVVPATIDDADWVQEAVAEVAAIAQELEAAAADAPTTPLLDDDPLCTLCLHGEGVHVDGCPYAKHRVVIFDADLGIYLGSADGVHCWSQWPGFPAGTAEALTFATVAEATAFVTGQDWDLREDWTCILVAVEEGSEFATEAACVAAGIAGWNQVDDTDRAPYQEAQTTSDLEIPESVRDFPGAPSAFDPEPAQREAAAVAEIAAAEAAIAAADAEITTLSAAADAEIAALSAESVPPEDAGEPAAAPEPEPAADDDDAASEDDAEDDPTNAPADDDDEDEPDPVAAEGKKAYKVDLTADRSKPLTADIAEGQYNARDVLSMCRVYSFLLDKIEATNTIDVYNLDRQLSDLALEMRRTGLPIDEDERKRVRKRMVELRDAAVQHLRPYTEGENRDRFVQILAEYAAVKARRSKSLKKPDPLPGEVDEETGLVYSTESAFLARVELRRVQMEKKLAKEGVNFNAKLQQAAILRIAGVPLLAVTPKSGQPKISKNELEEQRHHPAARAMLEATLTGKAVQFIDSMTVDADGRLRVHWSVHQITGRWATSPNVQNWSKRAGGGAENLRRMIKAPEGYKFVGFDYKQIEARIIAVLANVKFLKEIFARGGDVHGELAKEGFPGYPQLEASYFAHKGQTCGLPEACPSCNLSTKLFVKGCCPSDGCGVVLEEKCDHCQERDKLRDLTKRLEYGTFYGGKDTTLWESVSKDHPELTLQQVQNFMRAMNTKMPELAAWRARLVNEALEAGEIYSPIYGRRQVFPMERFDPTVVFNWGSQTGAAELWGTGALAFVERWPQKNPKYGGQTDVRVVHNGHDSAMILVKDELVEKVKEDVKACWEQEWGGVAFQIDAKVGERWSEV